MKFIDYCKSRNENYTLNQQGAIQGDNQNVVQARQLVIQAKQAIRTLINFNQQIGHYQNVLANDPLALDVISYAQRFKDVTPDDLG